MNKPQPKALRDWLAGDVSPNRPRQEMYLRPGIAPLAKRLACRRSSPHVPDECPILGVALSREAGSPHFPESVRGFWMSRLAATIVKANVTVEELERTIAYLRTR